MYLTSNHQDAPGVWCMCVDGQIVRRLGAANPQGGWALDLGRQIGLFALTASLPVWTAHTLTAAADDQYTVPWESDAICFVGVETSDKRIIDEAPTFRSFPLPLMAAFQTSWGHDGAFVVGRIDEGSASGESVPAKGVIDTLLPMGFQAARMVETGSLNRVSIDPSGGKVETEITEQDDDGWPMDYLDHYTELEIGGLTLVNISAFAESKMRLSAPIPGLEQDDESLAASGNIKPFTVVRAPVTKERALTAAGSAIDPPLGFFQDPQLAGRTRLTIDDPDANGHRRVYGHLAPWEECHIGIQGQCVMAPRSESGYAWFTLGSLKCDEGCVIPIGSITFRGTHADKHLPARAAAAHYDATCMQVADIAIGEDDHGIWFSGSMRTTVTEEDVRELRASRLSGDWRKVNGDFELVATHAVNTGGFPVYEEALAADGGVQTIIASLDDRDDAPAESKQDRALRIALAPLFKQRVEDLRERVNG